MWHQFHVVCASQVREQVRRVSALAHHDFVAKPAFSAVRRPVEVLPTFTLWWHVLVLWSTCVSDAWKVRREVIHGELWLVFMSRLLQEVSRVFVPPPEFHNSITILIDCQPNRGGVGQLIRSAIVAVTTKIAAVNHPSGFFRRSIHYSDLPAIHWGGRSITILTNFSRLSLRGVRLQSRS